ncbi:unnamed protein product, partial [Polarella glacialis]
DERDRAEAAAAARKAAEVAAKQKEILQMAEAGVGAGGLSKRMKKNLAAAKKTVGEDGYIAPGVQADDLQD